MIFCPKCCKYTIECIDEMICGNCGYKIIKEDGIFNFIVNESLKSEDYNEEYLDYLFRAEKLHFWFFIRNKILKNIFIKNVPKKSKILEIGSGTGYFAKKMMDCGYDIFCGDIYKNGLKYAMRQGVKQLFQFNVINNNPFKSEFDIICFFDVLEHIEDDKRFLSEIKRMLKKGGKIILTVPAHKWLWSRSDEISRHKRRYDLTELRNKIIEQGFDIELSKYFYVLITPLLKIRSVMKNKTETEEITLKEKTDFFKINMIINFLLKQICKIEIFLMKYFSFPFGGSIIIIAKSK